MNTTLALVHHTTPSRDVSRLAARRHDTLVSAGLVGRTRRGVRVRRTPGATP